MIPTADTNQLFYLDTIYIANGSSSQQVLTEIAQDLLRKNLVTEGFLSNLLEREKNYPTGMDMSLIDSALPNIAIPHTETEFVHETRIVPVKLTHPLRWHNMLVPTEELDVSFLFMILNASKEAQTGLLAHIMDFVNSLGVDGLKSFVALDTTEEIYDYLQKHFLNEGEG